MINRNAIRLTNGLLAVALLLIDAMGMITRELFHRVSGESLNLILCLILGILLVVSILLARRFLSEQAANKIGRLAVLLAIGSTAAFEFPQWSAKTSDWFASSMWSAGLICIAIGVVTTLTLAATDAVWCKIRSAILVLAIVFFGSQPIRVATLAPHIFWPPIAPEHAVANEGVGKKSLTVFLLLDELNAKAAAPIVAILRENALQVRTKSITPVADGTAKVIPAMFTGKDFRDAKPCGSTATCSGDNILDFSRVTASRPDVDVVGFFLPYCAIQGLRFCSRSVVAQATMDLDRWRCAIWRRTGYPRTATFDQCSQVFRKDWSAMTNNVVQSMWQAPAWKEGGFLFAHLPLPHPPGDTVSASLQSQYLGNLNRSYQLVHDIVNKMRLSGADSFRLVIFSDHPLRQSMWCNQGMYALQGCAPTTEFEDDKVPLIVAGTSVPNIDDIVRNDQIFVLAIR